MQLSGLSFFLPHEFFKRFKEVKSQLPYTAASVVGKVQLMHVSISCHPQEETHMNKEIREPVPQNKKENNSIET
ncbi:hypothetical protein M0R45_022032 [Rubus argutus]|uniref:Uncharacterized protein n=1 Tax=Rubus argutus TaxID=59490 RepID=A0AAW1XG17_RUBAR